MRFGPDFGKRKVQNIIGQKMLTIKNGQYLPVKITQFVRENT